MWLLTRYRLTFEAESDLDDISFHLVQQGGVPLARHVLTEIRKALRFLARNPGVAIHDRISRPNL